MHVLLFFFFFSSPKLVRQSDLIAHGKHDGGIGGHALERRIAEERAD